MKYSNKIVDKICELLASGKYRIEDVCKVVGITKATFYDWKEKKTYFSDKLKESEQKRLESFADMAKSGLAKLLDVHSFVETKTEYETVKDKDGKDARRVKSKTKTTKVIMPNPAAVIFTLTNRLPDDWKNKQDHTTNGESLNSGFLALMKKVTSKDE
jgi:hypothetical protein